MTDIKAPVADPASLVALPTARRTLTRLLRAWLVGLIIFGLCPSFAYGKLVWLFNEEQWRLTYLLYLTEVPLVGGFFLIFLPLRWYRPIHAAVAAWSDGAPVGQLTCTKIYEQAMQLPWKISQSSFAASVIGYVIGTSVLHWRAHQPWTEIIKTIPAIPLVGGMMGAFCYFATARALHPILAWCSIQLRQVTPPSHTSLAEKFLTTTTVLMISILCLVQPAAYTLGQVVTEQHLTQRSLARLRTVAQQAELAVRPEDRWDVMHEAVLGRHGYLFMMDPTTRTVSHHPKGFTSVGQEGFYDLETHVRDQEGAWVDRVGRHRVVAFIRLHEPERLIVSVSFPSDFSAPLYQHLALSWIILLDVFFVVFLFGRYYTRGITIPLGELTRAAERIAEQGDLSQPVPVTTNDELGELARSFNRMVERMQASRADVEEYTKRLEQSSQELAALNQEMEDLLRVVSHDLRAPLINIQGFSKRLEPILQQTVTTLDHLAQHSQENGMRREVESLKDTVQTRFVESLQFISKGVEKMDALLSSLLAISRVGRKADPLAPNDLDEILNDVLATFDHQLKEAAIQVIRQPLPQGVPCRANEINQVFSNLISNAINYMGATGERFIEIGGRQDHEVTECFVRDTGVGIAAEDRERIFQMFTRLQTVDIPGEGVGLAYVRKIVRSHGGRIWVTSDRGRGSTFFFTLPAHQPAVARS